MQIRSATDWNEQTKAEEWRAAWADICNQHLERGNINREIEISNQKLRQLKAQIVKLQNWVKEEAANTEPPTLADVIERILMRRQQSGKASIYSLKAAANMLNFFTAYGIMDMTGLDGKLQTMVDKQFSIRDKLKSTEQRLKTLDEHIRHSGNFKAYRGHKAQYEKAVLAIYGN